MELTRMKLADLRANPLNARTRFGGLDELADRLELTPGKPGEPLLPIVAVRDANVGRIVDGERRYRAMKRRGRVDECDVLLCDDMDDAAVAVAMLAANDREMLDASEVSRGYQQALLLGVPEEVVDRLSGTAGAGRALRRAIERNDGKAAQVTLDQASAAAEFADSEEDYDKVMASDRWEECARSIRWRRKEAAEKAELEAAIGECVGSFGLQVAEKPPKGAALDKTLYSLSGETVRKDGPTWAAAGKVLVRPYRKGGETYGHMTSWQLFEAPRELSDEEAAAQKSRNQWRRIRSAGEKRRAEWLGTLLAQGGGGTLWARLDPLASLVADYYEETRFNDVRDFLEKAGVPEDEWPVGVNAWMVAAAWPHVDHLNNMECDNIADPSCACYTKDPWEHHIALMLAMERSGYEPDDDERAFLELCEGRRGKGER